MIPHADLKRLSASLAVSCLLHAALVFSPLLGLRSSVALPGAQGGRGLHPARVLEATLVLEKSSTAVPEVVPENGNVSDAPAPRLAGEAPRPALERSRGIGLLPLPGPTYYGSDQLTKPARPTSDPVLNPRELGPVIASGTIILKLWINELGDVVAAEVETTDLPEAFSATAVAAFSGLRFTPGEIDGRPVATMMKIEVSYSDGRNLRR